MWSSSMDFYGLPDWKRIGRDIGKRLKDILNPSPHPGPSKEERRGQRIRDALKGLVYFDDFDELSAWQPSDGDPVQVSNYPLLKRATHQVHDQRHPTSKVILCHDYKGGYHDYESIRPEPLEHEMFSCEFLQYVDTFIYFSHKLVCVPPASWTNTLHRNGVRVLGTLIIEPQTSDNNRLLSFVDGEFIVAKTLASMAEYFGFDGWLLNVEKEFSGDLHDWPTSMVNFISSLRNHLEQQGRVLWYDALTLDNKREYQNALTEKNVCFAKAANGLFTNYKWTPQKVSSSRGIAKKNSISSSNIFFGIDVWAQNANISGHRRTTYPPQGGGGTNTGLGLRTLAANSASTAVFGPAWPFEHFSTSSDTSVNSSYPLSIAHRVNLSMWMGDTLPSDLQCDCRFRKPHHTEEYLSNPIVKYAQEYPAGTSHFLETHFSRAFSSYNHDHGHLESRVILPKLGSQDILPSLYSYPRPDWASGDGMIGDFALYGRLSDTPTTMLKVFSSITNDNESKFYEHSEPQYQLTLGEETLSRFRLFKVNMPGDGSLQARLKLERKYESRNVDFGLYAAYDVLPLPNLHFQQYKIPVNGGDERTTIFCLKGPSDAARLVELGLYMSISTTVSQLCMPLSLCDITEVIIQPPPPLHSRYCIQELSLVERGHLKKNEKRLSWQWRRENSDIKDEWPKELPWSKTTGPFSHFSINVQGREVAQVFCLEFPIRPEDLQGKEGENSQLEVFVAGKLFGGDHVYSAKIYLSKTDMYIT